MNKEISDKKIYSNLIKELDNMTSDLLDNLGNADFKENEYFITIGVKGNNYNIPLCADLYEYLRHLLFEMKEINRE